MRAPVALIISAIAAIVLAEGEDYDPLTQTCKRFQQSAAVLDNRLYIDGGQVLVGTGNQAQGDYNITNTHLLYHDLSNGTTGVPPLLTNLTKPSTIPSLLTPTLWPDSTNGRLFSYGGHWPSSNYTQAFTLHSYDAWHNTWSAHPVDTNAPISRAYHGGSVAVESSGLAYYYGGWVGALSMPEWRGKEHALNSLLVYDMVRDRWSNKTGPVDGMGRAEGLLVYVPRGDAGLLVYVGGVVVPEGDPEKEQPHSMSVVEVYDLNQERWYSQNATGDIPGPRRRFCGGIVAAPDNSSYNIYIFAGLGFPSTTGFSDLYILTLPSFTWIRAYADPQNLGISNYDNTCSIVHDSQMLIIGGLHGYGTNGSNCNVPEAWGVHSADLGKRNKEKALWYGFRPEVSGYEVPVEVSDVVGGGPDGNAKITRPEENWASENLQVLFSRTVSAAPRKPTRTPPQDPSTASSLSSAEIAGIAVGSIAAAALVFGLAAWGFIRRRKQLQLKQREIEVSATESMASPKSALPAYEQRMETGLGEKIGPAEAQGEEVRAELESAVERMELEGCAPESVEGVPGKWI